MRTRTVPHEPRHVLREAFQSFLDTLGYPYFEETNNPVYRLFLRTRAA